MKDQNEIGRKEFISACGIAALGLGLGGSCGRSGSGGAAAAPSAGKDTSAAAPADQPVAPAYRTLGRAKIKVTEIGFGASRTMDPQLIDYAIQSGMNFMDTGRAYFNGQNEILLGKVIKGRRDKVVLNSKIQPGPLSRMQADFEESLRALGTDYADVLMIHGASDPEEMDGEQVREFLTRAREQGKARVIGFSSHSNFVKLLEIAAAKAFHEVIMVPYNFMGAYTHMLGGSKSNWDAGALEKAIARCGQAGIDFVAMKSCSGGFMKGGEVPQTYEAALKWVLKNQYMKTTSTAMGNFQQIDENIRAMGAKGLGQAEQRLLDRYAALYGPWYCRMCGSCSGKCPAGVNVAEVNRFHMYAEGYGGEMAVEARRSYAGLGGSSARACLDCAGCSIECPYGLPLDGKLARAHSVLS
jgi:uncharacterized protein